MTNNEFLAKLNKLFELHMPIPSKKMTVNELIFVLRHDNEVEDYNLNINSKSLGFSFGLAKESFFPIRHLALKIDSIEYEEDDCEDESLRSPYPLLAVKTN
jgi:hypothetical protein